MLQYEANDIWKGELILEYGKVHEISFYSQLLDETFPILVYLPHEYSPMMEYQVIFASDGKDYIQYGRIGRVTEDLVEEGDIDQTIVVGIPYDSVKHRWHLYHPHGERNDLYIDFLATELLPYIDETYPTIQNREARGLIGDSLAATVSLMTLIRYPELFSKAMLHSPLVNEKVIEAVNNWQPSLPTTIYQVVGDRETKVKTSGDGIKDFVEPNKQLHQLLEDKNIDHFFDIFEGNHTWKYWQPDVPRAIRYAFRLY